MSFYASTGQPQDPAGQQPHPGHQSRPSQLPPPAIPHPSASPVGKGSSSSTTTGANSQQQQQTPATFKGLHQLTGAPTPPVPLSTVTAFGSGGLSGTGGGVGGGGLADGVSAVGGERGEREGGMSGGTAPGSSALGAGGEGGQHQQQQQVAGSAAGWGKNGSFGSSSVHEGVFEFTKRKKWANLLVNELSDTVVFVLVPSPQGGARIVYTSPGIRDLLGYSVKDVENRAIADLVYEPDLPPLLNCLQQSISNRTDLSSYHRFLPKRTPSSFLLSSPNPYAESTSDSPTFLASTPNNDDDGQGGVGTGMTTPSDDGDANQEAGRRGSVESGYGGIGINQSDRKADAAGRPVLLELRGHGYWGEEADRAPIPLSLTTGSAAIPSGLPGGNTPSLSSGSASSSSASISPSVQLGSNAIGNGSSSSGGDGQRCKCFFLMARRWPSRTGEMLDAFLEEKMENERLRAELMELMGPNGMAEEVYEGLNGNTDADYYLRQSTIPGLPSAFFSPTTSLLPPTSHAAGSQPPPLHHHSSSSSSSGAGGFLSQAGGSSFEYNRFHGGAEPSGGAYEDDNSVSASASASDDEDGDGAGYIPPASVQPAPATIATGWPRNKKAAAATDVAPGAGPSAGASASGSSTSKPAKKAKKSGTKDEGHVCTVCGRTDSPEWRKGPMGPKTLCNACGLRYAKKNAAASNALIKKKGASVVGTPAPGVGGGDR